MKKLSFFLCVMLCFGFVACNAQDISTALRNALGGNRYLEAKGKISVKKSSNNTVLLLFRSDGTNETDFDKAFVIFSETPITKFTISENDAFEIMIPSSRKYMAIYNSTKNKIFFIGTSDSKVEIDQIKAKNELSNYIANTDYLGYGFSYMKGKWSESRINESKYLTPFYTLDYANEQDTNLRLALPPDDDGGANDCTKCSSGGAGSSQCSIDEWPGVGCSVTCNAGYYACCNSKTVKCYCCKN